MLQKLVLTCVLFGSTVPTYDHQVARINKNEVLASHISTEYKVRHQKIYKVLKKIDSIVEQGFPRKSDILAIIAIESRFKSGAISSKGAKGLMQVLYKDTNNDYDNLVAGIKLLKEYRESLGSDKAAVHAYNVGIGNYRKGMRSNNYYSKYLVAKTQFKQIA